MSPETPYELVVDPDECRCGHARAEHHANGVCGRYQGEPTPVLGSKNMVEYPPGACYCKSFDNEPWRWNVSQHYSGPFPTHTDEDGRKWQTLTGGEPDSYGVHRQNRDKDYGPYETLAAAERKCEELNRLMLRGPLDPAFAERYKRLRDLAPRYGYLYDGPPEARWPIRPDRYLINGWDDGWHGDEWQQLADSLDAVKEVLRGDVGHEVFSVIDLDTGDDVAFERTVSVTLP